MSAIRKPLAVAALFCGTLLALSLLCLLPASAAPAPAAASTGSAFVRPGGMDEGDCGQGSPCGSIQYAIDRSQPGSGDTIYVAGGHYTGTAQAVISVTKGITLYGGWDGSPTGAVVRDPAAYPSVLDGERQRRVVFVSGDITPTIDGFTIANGNATGLVGECAGLSDQPCGCGGGILVDRAHPIISSNVITGNVGSMSATGYPATASGYGGGVYLGAAYGSVVRDNLFQGNTANPTGNGLGGGIIVVLADSRTVVEGNRFVGNRGAQQNGKGGGGGVAVVGGEPGIVDNEFTGNFAAGATFPLLWEPGAAIYERDASGIVAHNRMTGNYGASALYLELCTTRVEANRIVNNTVVQAVRLAYGQDNGPTLVNNILASSGELSCLGAVGSAEHPLKTALLHNTFGGYFSDIAVYVQSISVTMSLTNTIIGHHGIGIINDFPDGSTVTADHTLFDHILDRAVSAGVANIHPVPGPAAFWDLNKLDFHIACASGAIDAGINAGVLTDIDGDPRPFGSAPDVGADESLCGRLRLHAPCVSR